MRALEFLAGLTAALATPVDVHHAPSSHETAATPTIPVQTPTGSICAGASPTSPLTSAEAIAAVKGCTNIKRPGSNYTRNDLLSSSDSCACKKHTLLFARGTGEDGNMGNIVGPPFLAALEEVFGGEEAVAAQGVDRYPADGEYCTGGSVGGSEELAELIVRIQHQCPETLLTVSGYSQGCQLVHNAFALLASRSGTPSHSDNGDNINHHDAPHHWPSQKLPSTTTFINTVVLFGDPDRSIPLDGVPSSKVKTFCAEGDDICENGENVLEPHLMYCHDVGEAAEFVKSRAEEGRGWGSR